MPLGKVEQAPGCGGGTKEMVIEEKVDSVINDLT